MAFDINTARPVNEINNVQSSFDITTASPVSTGAELLTTPQQEIRRGSPINNLDRLTLAFSDDPGKENFLKERFSIVQRLPNGKFAVGNSIDNIQPIDPEGIENDLVGDLADIAGEIPVIAGQIIGGTIGAAGGPVGTIAGGAAGAAAGEAGKIAIGRTLGVREQSAVKEATDIAISGAFGAAGEGIAAGLSGLGKKAILRKGAKTLTKGIGRAEQPSRRLKTLAKIFKTTARVDEKDVITAGLYGFDKTLSTKYLDKKFLTKQIMPDFVDGLIKRQEALGKAVGDAIKKTGGKGWAIRNFGGKSLDIQPISGQLLQVLKNPAVGIVDDAGRLTRGAFTEAKDFNTFKELSRLFFSTNPKTGQLVPKNLKLREYLAFKDRISPKLNKFFDSKTANPLVERSMAQYFAAVDDVAKAATTPNGIVTSEIAQSNPFISANNAFSKWKKDLDLLKQNGLDIRDISALKAGVRDKTVISNKIEQFTRSLQERSDSAQNAFRIVSDQLPKKFPGGGLGNKVGTLTDELNKWSAAQGFNSANIDLLRFGMVTTLLGGLGIIRGEIPRPVEIGGALLIGTPAGARLTLKSLAKAGKLPQAALQRGGRAISGLGDIGGRVPSAATTQLLNLIQRQSQQ